MARSDAIGTVDGLAQLSFLVQGTLVRRAAALDLSLIQTRLLGILRDREPGMNELAKLLELDKSSVTGLVDRAARRGLVTRVPSTDDRRAARVRLTEPGRELVDGVAADFAADVHDILAGVPSSDRANLSVLVAKVLTSYADRHGIDLSTTTQTMDS
jgi:MarR family transcriptional regulator, lower aerobic nicotinate degradation pathway regulator